MYLMCAQFMQCLIQIGPYSFPNFVFIKVIVSKILACFQKHDENIVRINNYYIDCALSLSLRLNTIFDKSESITRTMPSISIFVIV